MTNGDWKEATRNSSYLYIGNFGNNLSQRKNLQIYKVLTSSLGSGEIKNLDTIKFHFPEQQELPGNYDHNFDAEAMIAFNDSLFVFTKNWQNGQCSIYALPIEEGDYSASLISTFDTRETVTGATFIQKLRKRSFWDTISTDLEMSFTLSYGYSQKL